MLRLLTICLLLLATMLHAEEWRSESHGVAITLPPDEPWQQGNALRLPAADMIFRADQMTTRESIFLAVMPLMPSSDIENPAILSRIMETMKAAGFSIAGHTAIVWAGRTGVELTGSRSDATLGELTCLVRAVLKQGSVYMAIMIGHGGEERLKDKTFRRVIDTFQFVEANTRAPLTANPLFGHYRMAYMGCAGAAGLLLVVLGPTLLFSRRRHHR